MRRYTAALALFAVSAAIAAAGPAKATSASGAANPRPEAVRTQPRTQPKARSTQQVRTVSARSTSQDRTASAQHLLTAAVARLVRADGGQVTVAVDDLTTGAQAAYGGTKRFVTASIVKVDILATLLYQQQQGNQGLTPQEQQLATTMIENSDDDAATDLYNQVNGPGGITQVNRILGLRQTTVGTDGYWGLTVTTADDQIRLLRQVFTRPSALSPASQDYLQYLMSHVETDQQWGVSAAASPGTRFMVKNGWLPNPSLWEINSIGEIVCDHQRMLIAVLSDDNAGEYSGIAVVQEVARKAAAAVAASDDHITPSRVVAFRRRTPAAHRPMPAESAFNGALRA
jgi:Beta-lactamase enzyme family